MTTDVEPFIAALFTALQSDAVLAGQVKTFGRRLKWWQETAEQPALFLRHVADEDQYDHDTLGRTTVECEIWVYAKTGPDDVPDTTLNAVVAAVRNVLAQDDGDGSFTLGGLVYWCRIEGKSQYDPGDADQQGKAIIPVRMLVP
jgi:hypothetical protein